MENELIGKRIKGKIVYYKKDLERYGFIYSPELSKDIYFYHVDVEFDLDKIQVGKIVSLILCRNSKGYRAINIQGDS